MSFSVKIIADTVSNAGKRITTFQLKYPRFIHSEVMTHRAISRNASSSRAIPVTKIIESIMTDPAMPVSWGKNQKGMQAEGDVDIDTASKARIAWLDARDAAVRKADELITLGIHKQIANRILEPWSHIHVVATATEWDNFFHLRCHKDAQPEFQLLATMMRDAMKASTPELGVFHLPYISKLDRDTLTLDQARRCSVARCARVSYNKHDGQKPTMSEDLELFSKLAEANPKHMSPTEHQAEAFSNTFVQSGNFFGWNQYRKTLHGECFYAKL